MREHPVRILHRCTTARRNMYCLAMHFFIGLSHLFWCALNRGNHTTTKRRSTSESTDSRDVKPPLDAAKRCTADLRIGRRGALRSPINYRRQSSYYKRKLARTWSEYRECRRIILVSINCETLKIESPGRNKEEQLVVTEADTLYMAKVAWRRGLSHVPFSAIFPGELRAELRET